MDICVECNKNPREKGKSFCSEQCHRAYWNGPRFHGTQPVSKVFKPAGDSCPEVQCKHSSVIESPVVKPSEGKPPISLIPREAIIETAKCFDYGSKKHGRYAFHSGVEYTKLIDAALRHLFAIADGEDIDEESGNKHAGAVIANMAMLISMYSKPEFDDRKKS